MKKFVALLVMLVMGGTLLAQTPAPTPTTPAPVAPAAPDAKKPKPDAKKPEAEAKIDGLVIKRNNGTFLGLTLVEGKFHLAFYDKKKKAMALDVARAIARWPNVQGSGDNRTVLNPVGAGALQGAAFVRGPYVFKLYLTLLKPDDAADKDTTAETYVVDFRG